MFEGMKGMGEAMKLLGQAGKIRENMEQAQRRARERTATAEAGAGMVKATANGLGEIVAVEYDSEALKDAESLGPLTAAAVNLALLRGKEILMEETKTAMGGIDLPPGLL